MVLRVGNSAGDDLLLPVQAVQSLQLRSAVGWPGVDSLLNFPQVCSEGCIQTENIIARSWSFKVSFFCCTVAFFPSTRDLFFRLRS